jgi:SNF2 family DNA or RNA helicase
MKERGTKRNLVVAPASLVHNWKKEVERWYPEAMCHVIEGTPLKREARWKYPYIQDVPYVYIVSKDTVKQDIKIAKETVFDTCFVDECHFLRNPKTAQSKAIYQIKAERRYALTGTPSVKSAMDIWGILHFLYPQKFSSYWDFFNRYIETRKNWAGYDEIIGVKPHRKDELEELIGFISVQRKRKEVMEWLPDKERITIHCKMEGKQLKLYNQMKDDFLASDEEGNEVDTPGVLSQLMRLRQICLDPTLLELKAPSAKTEALLEYLENNSDPVVIMSMFTSYLEMLKEKLQNLEEKVGEINGKMSNHEKEKNAMAFQNGDTRILLCNIISAGTGFTLDRAETILFTDYPYNPSELEQAEDRITPTTEARIHKHTIVSFVCSDSVDEKIQKIIENKKSLTDVINEGGREAIKRLLK